MKTWRLPSIAELFSMYNRETNTMIEGFDSPSYWSSTIESLDNFGDELVYVAGFRYPMLSIKNSSDFSCVRCVRDTPNPRILELAPSFIEDISYLDIPKYIDNLDIDERDIKKVKLKGFYYEVLDD